MRSRAKEAHVTGEKDVIRVRPALRSDSSRFAELMAEFSEVRLTARQVDSRFRLIANGPGQSLAVATVNGFVVGLVGFRLRHNLESASHYGEISAIVVDPGWRNRGVGRALLEYAETLARRRKCVGLWLVSGFGREENAHKFHDRAGFSRTGVRFVKWIGDTAL